MWKQNILVNRSALGAVCFCLLVAVCTFFVTNIVSTTNYSPDLSSCKSDVKILPKMKTVDKIMHIAFLKVPKTGSSTLACIFLKFSIRNKLDIYLPKSTVSVSPKKQKLLLEEKKYYDIFVMHTYYDSTFFTNIVPRDSAIIGLVREPTQRIISHAFYKLLRKRKEMKSLSEQEFIHKVLRNTAKYGVQNIMATFFGMERSQTKKDYIHQYLGSLNTSFSLVLVLEKINESLVLLKRILNWSFADILYGAKKVNTYGNVSLSKEEKHKLFSNNMLDFEIYNYFKELESNN